MECCERPILPQTSRAAIYSAAEAGITRPRESLGSERQNATFAICRDLVNDECSILGYAEGKILTSAGSAEADFRIASRERATSWLRG